jgi:hypothetical protein
MGKHQEERELSTFDLSDTERLLRFNVTKQRIVDLANEEFEADWFDEAKDYSSWNRALNGHPVWIGLVDRLEAVMADQIAQPRKYLPTEDPPDADQLVSWMKQIAGAPWWHEVLKLSTPLGSFKNWYSGAALGKDKVAEVKSKVDDWWARVMAACERAELRSRGEKFSRKIWRAMREGPPDYDPENIESHFYHLVVEMGTSVEEARLLYQDLTDLGANYRAHLIDLTDPKDPLWLWEERSKEFRDYYGLEFDQMIEDGFPRAVPKFQPPFNPYEVIEQKRWGDRRDEDSPKDLNEELYGRFYRERTRHFWDPVTRRGDCEREITETSQDGVTWREATEREKQGWDRGTYFFLESLNRGVWPDNSYTRDLDDLGRQFMKEREDLERALRDADGEDALDRAEVALQAAERRFEEAKVRLRLLDLE